jgi:hypothetical protein
LPIGQRLKAVHHGTIEAISSVRQNENDDVDVESAQVGSLPPCHPWVSAASEEEVSLRRFERDSALRGLGWTERDHRGK